MQHRRVRHGRQGGLSLRTHEATERPALTNRYVIGRLHGRTIQAKILDTFDGWARLQLFGWALGEPTEEIIVPVARIRAGWQIFEDHHAWLAAGERVIQDEILRHRSA
jgi:hypothetical protein